MENEPPKLTDAEEAFLARVNDDLRADVNHISIFASVCIFVMVLLLLSVSLSFLGAVGNVMLRNGGLDRFNINTDTGFIVAMIGAALLFVGSVVTIMSIWFVSRLRRAFDHSYEKTEDIFRRSFEEAHLKLEGKVVDTKDSF